MLNKAINKWELSNLKCINCSESKLVYSVYSNIYGNCILKIDLNNNLETEFSYLNCFKDTCVCKVYGYDKEINALLLEKIIPGATLRSEMSLEKRLNVYYHLLCYLHKSTDTQFDCPTYQDWFKAVLKNITEINKEFELKLIEANSICNMMFEKYKNHMVLHGDLHHDNILLNDKGNYVIIDPKGVIGPPILELGRFILNELDLGNNVKSIEHVKEVVIEISKLFNYEFKDVVKVFYIETVLANAWNIEDGLSVNYLQLQVVDELLEWINEYK